MSQFSILEKVAATRAILTVAKSVQERRPDASVEDVLTAIEAAVLVKLDKLSSKPFAKLSAAQVASLGALKTAKSVMPAVLDFLGDAETTRALDASERDALASLKAVAAAKRKANSKVKVQAEAVKPKTADMFAKA